MDDQLDLFVKRYQISVPDEGWGWEVVMYAAGRWAVRRSVRELERSGFDRQVSILVERV